MYSKELVCNIIKYLNDNYKTDINIDDLSSLFFYNRTYIMKLFKKEVGIKIHEYLNIKKIYHSLYFFNDDNYILSIALKNGFNSLEYYSEIFKKYMGVSPIIFKRFVNHKNINEEERKLIFMNLSKLKSIIDKVLVYYNNKKPDYDNYIKKYQLKIKY